MKKRMIPLLIGLSAMVFLAGCDIALSFGGGRKDSTSSTTSTTNNSAKTSNDQHCVDVQPTIGQQLMDLKKAKDSGAITEKEYEAQKAKLLGNK